MCFKMVEKKGLIDLIGRNVEITLATVINFVKEMPDIGMGNIFSVGDKDYGYRLLVVNEDHPEFKNLKAEIHGV